ncbi:microfibril-associated glycoprotein 4-like [Fundulus diaphanus]
MMIQVILLLAQLLLAVSLQSNSQVYLPIDCDDIYKHDNKSSSGVYTIYPGGPTTPLHVYCDMETDGGRWTVFLRRLDGTESFFRPWKHYKAGFGNVAGEYWLGLENVLLLTMRNENELRVDMEDWEGAQASAQYSSFSIGPESAGYQLHLGNFTGGTAGDSLSYQNSMKFTTFDKDQDTWDKNCAQHYLGGFWYKTCHTANPTGMYAPHRAIGLDRVHVIWHAWKGWDCSLKNIAMKIRSVAKCSLEEADLGELQQQTRVAECPSPPRRGAGKQEVGFFLEQCDQALINDILRDFINNFVFVYLDDILIFSQNPSEHRQHVRLSRGPVKRRTRRAAESETKAVQPAEEARLPGRLSS